MILATTETPLGSLDWEESIFIIPAQVNLSHRLKVLSHYT